MNVFITGASRGLGRELALHYLRQGHGVVAVARQAATLEALRCSAVGLPGVLHLAAADVTDRDRMAAIVQDAEAVLGPVDLLIANAGLATQQFTDRLNLGDFAPVTATNVVGVLNTLLPMLERMSARRRGHVVVVSSLAALVPVPRLAVYGASKAWAHHLVDSLHDTLRRRGITAGVVCPGFIGTEMASGQQVPTALCMDVCRAALRVADAIACRRRFDAFPRWQYWLLMVLAVLPRGLRDRAATMIGARFLPPPGDRPEELNVRS